MRRMFGPLRRRYRTFSRGVSFWSLDNATSGNRETLLLELVERRPFPRIGVSFKTTPEETSGSRSQQRTPSGTLVPEVLPATTTFDL